MPKECGSWRAFRAQACHPPRPCPPSALSADTESAPGPPPFSSATLLLCELAHRAHTDTGLNRPCVQSAPPSSASGVSVITAIKKGKKQHMRRMCCVLIWPEKEFQHRLLRVD
ncbi:hypothetical protein CesoFtcFv8_012555 [Champsocephalus esox]|uniref:Uncharacterized protein n=2 Tax=Champsocephalus TaxID=52236 RepID=A0AAN8HN60_CHAGU|nr:hypothetical protein CesoFtcFv8_012555 [Champsocephalus esox]KAK5922086.1 hypothetical protein CgunFtcFv8_019384 [Champsocephalus gunnari]